MADINDKLIQLAEAKSGIKDAIIEKGVEVDSSLPFLQYADKIREISGGGGSYLIDSFVDGTSGYRIYSDGYCEQWGFSIVNIDNTQTFFEITIPKTFRDTDYNVQLSFNHNSGGFSYPFLSYNQGAKTVNSLPCSARNVYSYYWRFYGYLAEGEY